MTFLITYTYMHSIIVTSTGPELADMVIIAMYTDDACARIAGIHMSCARNAI